MDMNRRRMALISKLYFKDDMTQQEIAKKLDISRMKVSRTLQKAKAEGIVKVIIDYSGIYPELEENLCKKYNLKEVIIVDSSQEESSKVQVASAAAYYLENHLTKGAKVAVGWGKTICLIPEFMNELKDSTLTFSPIIGGHGQSALNMHASTIASNFAKKTEGKSLSLVAPALADTNEEKDVLLASNQIKKVIAYSTGAEYAIFSLGNPVVPGSSISLSGYLTQENLDELKEKEVICDVVSVAFLNRDGEKKCDNITKRCISISSEQLKSIPKKICVIEGSEKKQTVHAAIKAGFIDILITTVDIAEYLIEDV